MESKYLLAKILVVDDEPQLERLILQRFRKKVKNQEYDFTFAKDGIEALEKIKAEGNYDVVLSDINMPKMDGLAFIAQLQKIRLLLKTIMVSAYGDMKNIRTAMNSGAYDFIIKPIDFEDLEVTLNKALNEVELLKSAAQTREELNSMHQELNVASEIQKSILTKNFSIFPDNIPFEVFAEMKPAKEIGGDFYDFFKIDKERYGIVIGDVSGKGMPAALFMAVSRTLLKATATRGDTPADCLSQVNYLLSQDNPTSMFVTLIYGVLNVTTGVLEYCSGGHNPPCLLSAQGEIQLLNHSKNTALGVIEDLEYKASEINIEKGSSLILYTDGITEAINSDKVEFSENRLKHYLQDCAGLSSKEIINGLLSNVGDFVKEEPQSDDITTLVLKRNG